MLDRIANRIDILRLLLPLYLAVGTMLLLFAKPLLKLAAPWSSYAAMLSMRSDPTLFGIPFFFLGGLLLLALVVWGQQRTRRRIYETQLTPMGFTGRLGFRSAALKAEWGGRLVDFTLQAGGQGSAGHTTLTLPVNAQTRWTVYSTTAFGSVLSRAAGVETLTEVPPPLDTRKVRAEDPVHMRQLFDNPVALQALVTLTERVGGAHPTIELLPGHLVLFVPRANLQDLTIANLTRWRDALLALADAAEATPVAAPRELKPSEATTVSVATGTNATLNTVRNVGGCALTGFVVINAIAMMFFAVFMALFVAYFYANSPGVRVGAGLHGLAMTSDDGCVVVGEQRDHLSKSTLVLARLDSHGKVTWVRTRDDHEGEVGRDVVATRDGFAIVGDHGSSDLDTRMWLLETSRSGRQRSTHSYSTSGSGHARAIAVDPRGGLFIGGDAGGARILRVDRDREVRWRHTEPVQASELHAVAPYKGGVIVAGHTLTTERTRDGMRQVTRPLLESFDARGRSRWRWQPGPLHGTIDAIAVHDGIIAAVGHDTQVSTAFLWLIDTNDLAWAPTEVRLFDTIDSAISGVAHTKDGWVAVGRIGTRGVVMKIDEDGRRVWTRALRDELVELNDVAVARGGELVVAGTVEDGFNRRAGWVARLKPNGGLRWSKTLRAP